MVTKESIALERRLRNNLAELQRQLCIAQSGVTVATQFLKTQDAAQDWDVANILEHCVGSCLARQIECMDALIAELGIPCVDAASSESMDAEQMPLQ